MSFKSSPFFYVVCDLQRRHTPLLFLLKFPSFWLLRRLLCQSFCISSFPYEQAMLISRSRSSQVLRYRFQFSVPFVCGICRSSLFSNDCYLFSLLVLAVLLVSSTHFLYRVQLIDHFSRTKNYTTKIREAPSQRSHHSIKRSSGRKIWLCTV